MRELLVSDYDGTFYRSDEEIEQNIKYVERFRKKGNLFVIATGRSYLDYMEKEKKYAIKCDYVILNSGATILKDDKIVSNIAMEEEIIEKLILQLGLRDQDEMFACSGLESRVSIKEKNITKIYLKFPTKEEALKISKEINQKYASFVNCYFLSSGAIEIVSAKINKAKAIHQIMEMEDIEKINVKVIGDSDNDYEMIKEFRGYCVNNATEEVKRIARKEVDSASILIKELMKEKNK